MCHLCSGCFYSGYLPSFVLTAIITVLPGSDTRIQRASTFATSYLRSRCHLLTLSSSGSLIVPDANPFLFVGVASFGDVPLCYLCPFVNEAVFRQRSSNILAYLSSLQATHETTRLLDAIDHAYQLLSQYSGVRRLILMTDGNDNASSSSSKEKFADLRLAKDRLQIDLLVLGLTSLDSGMDSGRERPWGQVCVS